MMRHLPRACWLAATTMAPASALVRRSRATACHFEGPEVLAAIGKLTEGVSAPQ
jgi:hypothetical protein